jgi:hypothetical protein
MRSLADSRPTLDWAFAAAIDAVFVGIRRQKRKLAQ